MEWVAEIDISGRSKHMWSIHNKIQKEGKDLSQIFDLMAIRVILTPCPLIVPAGTDEKRKERTESTREKRLCYHTLSIVHSIWTPLPGRIKDYIAVPKANGYQSLHTTVIIQEGQPIEIQIRSRRMHEVAEFGVAAHWMYKQGNHLTQKDRDDWIAQLKDLQHDFNDASDYIDAVKTDILSQRVRVFTPKGLAINLPSGSTTVDFAFHIHSRIGETAVGARVSGKIVPLSYRLNNGDVVEIQTNKNSKPSKDWMNFVVTRSARTKIRHHINLQNRGEDTKRGHDLLERYLRKRQLPVRQLMRTKLLEDVTHKLVGTRNPDDLYLALNAGKLTSATVARVLSPSLAKELGVVQQKRTPSKPATRPSDSNGVYVEGFSTTTKLSHCCNPIRGDQIMGYLTRGRGVSIHRVDCPSIVRLLKDEPERCIATSWDAGTPGSYLVDLAVLAGARAGLLQDVMAVLKSEDRSAIKVEASLNADGKTDTINLRLAVMGNADLEQLRAAFMNILGVTKVKRLTRPINKSRSELAG